MLSAFGRVEGLLESDLDMLIRALKPAQSLPLKDIMMLRHREITESQ